MSVISKLLSSSLIVGSCLLTLACQANSNTGSLYAQNCASCHGKNLQGGSGSSLIDDEWSYGSSANDIAKVIRDGVVDMGMPAWGGTLDDTQIRGLVIYIKEQKFNAEKSDLLARVQPKNGIFKSELHDFKMTEVAAIPGVLWSLDFMPDKSILVTERGGKLWHVKNGKTTEISGIPQVWQRGQGGLLEVQLHPDYSKNGWIYLSYSKKGGSNSGMTTVVRGKIKNGVWGEEQNIFEVDENLHSSSGAHFGSRFVFDNGYVFFSIGDRGRKEHAQDLGRPNGKIYRIHDDGRIPKDNPFVGNKKALPAIWSYGHRNPQGLDMDPATGILWGAEHGPRGGDEINVIEKGLNYGWPEITYGMNYNGTPMSAETEREGMEQPKLYWVPSIAVAGIEFYEGNMFEKWQGKLLVSGMASEELHLLTLKEKMVVRDDILLKNQGRIRDVANGPDGSIYLLLNTSASGVGKVVKLAAVD